MTEAVNNHLLDFFTYFDTNSKSISFAFVLVCTEVSFGFV